MFYKLDEGHPFSHDPSKAFIAPRPIAWVGTRGDQGDNLAAFSYFMMISSDPMLLAFAVSPDARAGHETKDTLHNIKASGVFSVSIPTQKHLAQVVLSGVAAPLGVDEFDYAGALKAECQLINAPYVGDAAATVECALERIEAFGTTRLVVGRGLGVHLDEAFIKDDKFQARDAQLLARLGYFDYTFVDNIEAQPTPRFAPKT